jgi:hypothetical protein
MLKYNSTYSIIPLIWMLMLQKFCTSALGEKVPRPEVSPSLTLNKHTNTVNLSCCLEFIKPTELFNGFKRS